MKTFEQFCRDNGALFTEFKPAVLAIDQKAYESIQLDSVKEGMSIAAEIVYPKDSSAVYATPDLALIREQIRRLIERASEERKSV